MFPFKVRKSLLTVSVLAMLVMMFLLAGAAYADSPTPTTGTICVEGYVINHREVAVDGTRTTPPLVVEGVAADGSSVTAAVASNGYWKLANLAAGDWNFRMQLPADWDSIVPEAARGGMAETGATAIAERKDGSCYKVVFKIRRLFDVTVIKWEELLDGSVQPGADWEIAFVPQGDPFVKTQTKKTNASGGAVFTVTPGKWLVQETLKSGWTPVTPAHVYLTLDQYATPGAMDPVVFKNRQPACKGAITVEKTGLGRDANGGLVWLGPLAGWQITLSRYDGHMYPVTKVTDASGKVTFDGLLPGVYKVQEHVQVGWKPVSDNPQTVVLSGCDPVTVLFENEEIAGQLTISGKKYFRAWVPPYAGHDVGLSGWVITATLKGTDIYTTTKTDAFGNYLFTADQLKAAGMGFAGASIEVCEADRYNWIHVTPKCMVVTFPYPVPADYKGAVVNFTNIQDPPLPGMGGVAAAPVTGGACASGYVVQPGDTLSGIAAGNGTSVSALAQANGISNPNYLRAGATLCLP